MGQFQSKCFSAKADAVPASSKADSGGVVVEGVPCRQVRRRWAMGDDGRVFPAALALSSHHHAEADDIPLRRPSRQDLPMWRRSFCT